MKKTPNGWPRISTSLYYEDAAKAIDWLCKVFGFELRLRIEGKDGAIEHSELVYGEGLIMVSGSNKPGRPDREHQRAPTAAGGANTQNMMVFVDDVDAHHAHARATGATIVSEPKTTDYGAEYWADRTYQVVDLGGHHWWFCQRVREQEPRS